MGSLRPLGPTASHQPALVPMLLRKVWTDTRALSKQALSLMLLIGLGIALFIGTYQAYQNLDDTYGWIWSSNRFADASVQVERAPEGLVGTARTIPHVTAAMGRIVRDGSIEQPDKEQEHARGRFLGVPRNQRPKLNDVWVLKGRYIRAAHEALLEHQFAKENKYRLGELIKCRYGTREREFTIVGFVASPEYIFLVPSRHEMWVDRKAFGVVFVDEDQARNWLGVGRQVTEIHCAVEPGYEEEVVAKLAGLAQPYGVEYAYTQDMQAGKRVMRMDQSGFAVMSVFFPVLFLSAAGLTLYGALTRIVRMQVSIIGMLKANGFSDRQILIQQVLVGVLIAVGGAIPGAVLGHLMAVGLAELYAHYLYLPDIMHPIRPGTITLGFVLAALTGLSASYLPARVAAKLAPATAMRGDIDGGGRLTGQQSILRWTNFRRILYIIPVRGIARRASSTLLAVAGIAGGVCILVTTFGIHVSVQDAIGEFVGDVRQYDIDVSFTHPSARTLADGVAALPDGVSASHNATVPVRVRTSWGAGETILTGIEQGQRSLRIKTLGGGPMHVEPGRLWLPKQLARKLRAEPGDPLQVEWVRSSRRRSVNRVMQMAGSLDVAFGNMAYGEYRDVRRHFADKLFPEAGYGAYVAVAPSTVVATKNRLEKSGDVAFVSTTADVKKQVDQQMKMMWVFIAVLLSFGGLLAGSSIHSVASVAVLERQRELATLLSLGFSASSTAWLIAMELGVLGTLGLILGLPLGSALNTAYISSFETESIAYRAYLPPWVFIVSSLVVFGLVAISSYMAKRRLLAMDLSQATKAQE